MNTRDETATFSFNLAPSVTVLTVTRPDGSVVRHTTIEDGAADHVTASGPDVGQQCVARRRDHDRHRRARAHVASRSHHPLVRD